MIEFNGNRFERDVNLRCVPSYGAHTFSDRQLEEMMKQQGVDVEHSRLNRWVEKYAPLLDQQCRARSSPGDSSWREYEMGTRLKLRWTHLYRSVIEPGGAVNALFTVKRERKARLWLLLTAIGRRGDQEKIAINKSGASMGALVRCNVAHETHIGIRPIKYQSNILENKRSDVKRVVWPTTSFNSLRSAAASIAITEPMHMICEPKLRATDKLRPPKQFYAQAG